MYENSAVCCVVCTVLESDEQEHLSLSTQSLTRSCNKVNEFYISDSCFLLQVFVLSISVSTAAVLFAEKCRLSALRQVIFKWQFATVSDFQIKANTKTFVPFKCKEAEYKGK